MAEPKVAYYHAQKMAHQWQVYTPPNRPSKSECQIIEKFIAQHKKPAKILILGGTPEFRDLVHRQKAEVTCVDISLDMLMAMTKWVKYQKNADKETWIKAGWLTMPVAQNYYDFVLGDFVICNIPIKLQPKFLAKIREVLKPGGCFITRHLFPIFPKKSIQEFINLVIKKKFNQESISEFAYGGLFVVWKAKDSSTSTDGISSALKKSWQDEKNAARKKQIAKLIKIFHQQWPLGKTWWTLPEKEGEKMMKKYFKISAVKYGTDHPFVHQCPIYFLKK
ncbi:MAG: class I SAM-dependent methyltransferase [Patescibacteria group bacterium]